MEDNYLPVHCYDEFTDLQEVFISSVIGCNHNIDISFRAFFNKVNISDDSVKQFKIPDEILIEHEEEIENLDKVLTDLGILVRHQEPYNYITPFSTPYWKAYTRPSDNPRDQMIVIGDTFVETPPVVRDRYFENDAWKKHIYGYFNAGSNWINAPRPMMLKNSLKIINKQDELDKIGEHYPLELKCQEMMFDGAQICKVGKDILMNVVTKGDEIGFKWISRLFPQYRWHKLNLGPTTDHLDGEFAIIKPGLLLVTPRIVNNPSFLPKFMQKWDMIPLSDKCLPIEDTELAKYNLASETIYVNILTVKPNVVIISDAATETIKMLEKHKVECICVKYNYMRLFGGGIHCSTLDIRRKGELEDYSS